MKKAIILFSFCAQGLSLTEWFKVGADSDGRGRFSPALIGENQEYLAVEKSAKFTTYLMDFEAGTATSVKEETITDSNLVSSTRSGGFGSFYLIGSLAVGLVNPFPDQDFNVREFQVTLQGTKKSWYPVPIFNTVYFLAVGPGSHRLNPVQMADIVKFDEGVDSKAYGALSGTNLILFSIKNTVKRKIFDYTNGGTNSLITEHTKTAGSNEERAFFSPEDERGYYVVSDKTAKNILTIKISDGTEHLSHDVNADLGGWAMGLSWVYDTDLVFAAKANGGSMALYDFMDTSKSRAVTVLTLASRIMQSPSFIWLKKRALVFLHSSTKPGDIIKISEADQPCSDLCATCHEVLRDRCTSCQPNSTPSGTSCTCNDGYYESRISYTNKQCLACSVLCATCSGGATTNCLTCKDSNAEVKGDGSCGCRDGFYLSGTTCLPCDSTCTTCSGPTTNDCLSCFQAGFFLKTTTCTSCASETSGDCPTATTITVRSEIQENTRTLELDFSPSLKDQMESANQASALSVENLLKNNIKIVYGNDESNEADITVLGTRMSHSTSSANGRLPDSATPAAGQTHSYVYISFLHHLRKSNKDYLKVTLKSPWIYKPTSRAQHQQTVYLSEGWTKKIMASEKVLSEEEKTLETVEWLGKDLSAVIGVTSMISVPIAFILGWATNFLGSLIRVFNIANVVANIGKMNVELATSVNATFTFADNIRVPEWGSLGKRSPIEDYEWSEKDRDAHQTHLRGTRGKITINNDRVFLGSGQSFFISLIILLLRLVLIPILEAFLGNKNIVLAVVTFIYQAIYGVFFYQYQLICLAEIAMIDYERIPDPQFRAGFFASLFLSITLLVVMVLDIVDNFLVVKKLRKTVTGDEQRVKIEPDQNMSINMRFTLERLTGVLNLEESSNESYYKIPALETLRFFLIQILIATLQLLNKTQCVLVFFTNLALFVYFFRALLTTKVYKSMFITLKAAVLEICLMILVTTMVVFALADNTGFSDSWLHKVLEQGAVIAILGAVGAEFVNLVVETIQQFIVIFKRCQPKK